MNCWIPIFNIKKEQNLMYVPKKQKIKYNKINVKKIKLKFVKKASNYHKLGFLLTQKKILSGVDLRKAKRFNVPNNKFLLFNGNLIHGNGENLSKNIRFAIGIGLINASNLSKIF